MAITHLFAAKNQRRPDAPGMRGDKPKPLMRFRLLASKHIGPDPAAEEEIVYSPISGEPIGVRYPSREWTAGQIVESYTDLVDKHGANKFQRLSDSEMRTEDEREERRSMRAEARRLKEEGADTTEEPGHYADPVTQELISDPAQIHQRAGVAKAPHGQISTGHQEAVQPTENNPARGGPLSPEGRKTMERAGHKMPHDPTDEGQGNDPLKSTQADSDEDGDGNTPSHGGPGTVQSAASPQKKEGEVKLQRPKTKPPANLDAMSLAEMKKHAQREEIDLGDAKTRDEVVKAIRQHHS